MQWVTMVVMEFDVEGGMTSRGFQWGIIEVKGGLDGVRVDDGLMEQVSVSSNFSSFLLTSFLISLVILDSFLLTTFSNFLISVSSLVLLIFSEECSVFRVLSLLRVLSRFLYHASQET